MDGTKPGTCATASLIGTFALHGADGRDMTPASALRQALLAVLLTAPRMRMSRKALQVLFWGGAAPDRASGSLRTALFVLRQDLAALGPDVVAADRTAVWLDPARFRIDGATRGPRFLEGIDLGLQGCEEFEDWLRSQRGAEALSEAAPERPAPALLGGEPGRLRLGLLRQLPGLVAAGDVIRADLLVDLALRFLTQTTTAEIYDLRQLDTPSHPLPIESGAGPSHWLVCILDPSGGACRLRLSEAGSRRLIWSSDPIRLDEAEETALARGEFLAELLRASRVAEASGDLFPLTAMAAFFSLDAALIARTERQLRAMSSLDHNPVYDCLHAFAQVFKLHENIGPVETSSVESLCLTLAQVPLADPMLPLCQSLIGYTLHMLHAENGLALALMEEARSRAPNLALNLDHLAVLRLSGGDLAGAEEAFTRCLRFGASSPWRYTYEVTGAMLYLAKGEAPRALYHANQALFRQPRYLGALRYALAGLALAGKAPDARRMLTRIQSIRPAFDLSDWVEGFRRRSSTDLSRRLVTSLQDHSFL